MIYAQNIQNLMIEEQMTSKKRCFICKNYIPNAEVIKTNMGHVCRACLNTRQITPRKPIKRKASTDKPKVKKVVKRKRKPKTLKQQCDELWAECVKARAGYKSEISGKEGRQIGGDSILHSHHINGKATYRLRYELDNGVSLTAGEHKFGIHVEGRRKEYQKRIEAAKGKKIMDKINRISKFTTGTSSLQLIKIYLEQELKKALKITP